MMRFLWLHCMCSYLKNEGYFVLKIKLSKCWSTIFNSQLEMISEILHHSRSIAAILFLKQPSFDQLSIYDDGNSVLNVALEENILRIKIRRPHRPLNFPRKQNQRTWEQFFENIN